MFACMDVGRYIQTYYVMFKIRNVINRLGYVLEKQNLQHKPSKETE